MNTGSSKSLDSGAWRDLYKAALFEIDNARLPERIAQAEKALALRARELFHIAGDNIEEEQALDHTIAPSLSGIALRARLAYGVIRARCREII